MRCLVFSDIHGNLEALNAVLDDADGVDQCWCLGDIVGYGPNPNECVETIRALSPLICVAGNHDWAALDRLEMRDYSLNAHRASLWTRGQLTSRNFDYLGKLPKRAIDREFTLVHGSPRDPIWEYVDSTSIAEPNFRRFATPYCLVGHTHMPAIFVQSECECRPLEISLEQPFVFGGERMIINPGSVGHSRDGDTRASYVILNSGTLVVEYRRAAYSIETTRKKMQDAGMLKYWPLQGGTLIELETL